MFAELEPKSGADDVGYDRSSYQESLLIIQALAGAREILSTLGLPATNADAERLIRHLSNGYQDNEAAMRKLREGLASIAEAPLMDYE